MKSRWMLTGIVSLAVAACATPIAPTASGGGGGGAPAIAPDDAQVYPDGNPYRLMAVEELPIVGVTVDSELSTAPKARMTDGNQSTAWSNGPYRAATSWAAVELAEVQAIAAVALKTGTMPAGTKYDLQVSTNGTTWTTVLANQTNATWNMETRTLPAGTQGRFVRVFWTNSTASPQPHFSIYEISVTGTPGPAPSPSATPTATPTPAPTATPPPPTSDPIVKLRPTGATASSSYTTDYVTLSPNLAIDGDLSTQWADDPYKAPEGTYTLSFDQSYFIDQVRLKTGYLPPNVRFDIETSDDNATWRVVASRLTNTTWAMEAKAIVGQGRYVRVHFWNEYPYVGHLQLFEIEVYGRARVNTVTRSLRVDGLANKVAFQSGGCIGGFASVVHLDQAAYNDTARGIKFPALLGFTQGRYGYSLARLTAENVDKWSGDIGGCGGVSFLDTIDGLSDNSGQWTFTVQDPYGFRSPEVVSATEGVTTWSVDQAARLDLGSTPRRWKVGGAYLQPDQDLSFLPGVVLVYKRTDGVWDFIVPVGNAYPSGGPDVIETSGMVYAFHVDWDTTNRIYDAQLTFTAQD